MKETIQARSGVRDSEWGGVRPGRVEIMGVGEGREKHDSTESEQWKIMCI